MSGLPNPVERAEGTSPRNNDEVAADRSVSPADGELRGILPLGVLSVQFPAGKMKQRRFLRQELAAEWAEVSSYPDRGLW